MHVTIALLCHDIGYVRGVCRRDRPGVYATGIGDATVEIASTGTDAALTPYHVDRSKQFVYELLSHAGEPRAYALIADQTPRKEDPKHWTRFLRQDTAFFVGAGKIAKFLESPVYFVSMKRERRGYYEVRLDVLAEPPYEDIDDAVIVERYARCLERAILDSPADWLWLQKKWKYAKPATDEKTFPEGVPARVRL